MLVVPVFVVFIFQRKSSYDRVSILNKSIWIYIYPLHLIVITHHCQHDRLNLD